MVRVLVVRYEESSFLQLVVKKRLVVIEDVGFNVLVRGNDSIIFLNSSAWQVINQLNMQLSLIR